MYEQAESQEYSVLQNVAKSCHLINLNYQLQIYMEKRVAITWTTFVKI